MRPFFFHGLHIPEILPGLEDPLPGPDATAELPLYPVRERPAIRGAARTQIERRHEED